MDSTSQTYLSHIDNQKIVYSPDSLNNLCAFFIEHGISILDEYLGPDRISSHTGTNILSSKFIEVAKQRDIQGPLW